MIRKTPPLNRLLSTTTGIELRECARRKASSPTALQSDWISFPSVTRTVFFGKVTNSIKEIYEIVLHANEIGLSKVKVGVKASEVHNAVEDFINSTKYKGRFIHSTGHSIGLNVHDGLSISKKSETVLEEGMVITIEPGIYIPKIGGVRIEDDVIVRRNKAETITKAPKELTEVTIQ